MKIITNINDMQNYSRKAKEQKKLIGFIPTMGYLHEGHLSLIDLAKKYSDIIVVSVFVNPTQFAPNEDFDRYPRDFERDKKLCKDRIGTTHEGIIFHPSVSEMYPPDFSTYVNETKLSKGLCGRSRPHHFRGVTTVVTKLFNAVLPDIAVFGQKDAQQAAIIKRMVRDLNMPVKIIVGDIIRESDGLAMSSRNKYLSENERKNATSISKSLFEVKDAIENYGLRNTKRIIEQIERKISNASGKIDYIEVVNIETFEPVPKISGKTLIAVAAFFGNTRLIDNVIIDLQNEQNENP